MAVKSKTAITTEISTNFASGTDIHASEHRAVAQDIVDSYEDFVGSYTTVQIAALVGMTLRQIVYDSDKNDYRFYNGTRWVSMAHPTYEVYTANIAQSGTSIAVANVIENTFDDDFICVRNGIGQNNVEYQGSPFDVTKTACFITPGVWQGGAVRHLTFWCSGANAFTSEQLLSDGTYVDVFDNVTIEIRLYY